jgi:putative hemolysin
VFGNLISWNAGNNNSISHSVKKMANRFAEHLFSLRKLQTIYSTLPKCGDPDEFVSHALDSMHITHSIQQEDLEAVPACGPTVVIANHPFGGIDGLILASILCSVRKDVKILANYFLNRIPEMRPLLFAVDPFEKRSSIKQNRANLKQAFQWVKSGGLLVVFPAGEVSHFRWKTKKIEDSAWNKTFVRILRHSQAKVLPVYFKGSNSLIFQAAGLIHPLLRTVMLPREMIRKQSSHIRLKIGSAIPFKRISGITSDDELAAYLRFRTYLLGNAFDKTPVFLNTPIIKKKSRRKLEPIIAPKAQTDLNKEIAALPDSQSLTSSGNLFVYTAFAWQIPNILVEIGRLREDTFRRVGEGTGKAIDLDPFDTHYQHLFIWNNEANELVGAYRLAPTDEVVKIYGKEGLYTYTLFKYQTRLLSQIGPALEMSRSFVRPEYQKNFTPLLLLWKGIGQFIARHPRYKILFGAVSITNEYRSYSRQLMAAFLKSNCFFNDRNQLVRPRKPYPQKSIPELKTCASANWPDSIEELSRWISDIETDGKGVPILLKHYLKLGGKLLSFNIDPSFGNVLDGLIMVDLTQTDPKLLKRYMEPDGLAAFMAFHQQSAFDLPAAADIPGPIYAAAS